MLSSLGGELRDMPTKGPASCKPLRSLWRPPARSAAFKQYRQPGCHRVERGGGGGHRAGRNSSPCSPGLFASAASTAFLFPGDMAPGLMSSSLQRTKASRDEGHAQAEVGESWGFQSRASPHTSWCPQPGQGWSESAISLFSSLSLWVSRFLNFSRLWKI